ncbi:MAG: beta-propeller domain-containing protein, partial [Methylococcales bacterium]|nr:beta-propeller domain-containing protein [Methylococcales bacterium]
LSVVTAIPVQNPREYKSICIAGELDTFYASTASLYFASSRYAYSAQGNELIYDAPQEMLTDIHKFSLNSAEMDYRGSGQVEGHLGWHQDKKSFRFGEYQDYLRIATSQGNNWQRNSRTKITVLKEDPTNKTLKEISVIDNLGKVGERLYAARFVGKRGYLVTFRVTDPLIVIDFSEPEVPTVLGELEISGYSDYLQAVGDDFLLGIGKEAVADTSQVNNRGAWYQGVKVALYDVSSAEKLGEINSIVIGKRGTEATVLSDHHGLAWLKTNENHYTLALPIKLHESQRKLSRKEKSAPWTYYDWTHTGLYLFDIKTTASPSLTLTGKLIADVNKGSDNPVIERGNQEILNDRAVIQNKTVHYIHGDKVLSAPTTDLK